MDGVVKFFRSPHDSSCFGAKPPLLLIRADADSDMGVGHVMRCGALAQAWQSAGGKAIFAIASGTHELESRIRAWRSEAAVVHAKLGSIEDAAQTLQLCERHSADWLCVDGYHFSADYRLRVKSAGTRLFLVDDHGSCPPYLSDIVLNANPQASEALYQQRGPRTHLLLGPRYALLRQEFLNCQRQSTKVPDLAHRILITLGGADSRNVTLMVMQALGGLTDLPLQIDVVVGAVNPNLKSLQESAAASPHLVRILSNVENMPDLIMNSDLAITAGGGTCYELAFLQAPMFLMITADNHDLTVQTWAKNRAAISAGWFTLTTRESLASALREAIHDQKLRREVVENASRMVDGKGALRCVDMMSSMSGEMTNREDRITA
jgi:UDP-2,4-diacetamido-2,4,6-trideoxy-beta-L-altropyranose hydrolase